ncbi:uncharacterized protein zbtb48 isoform X3 [Paramormyrops kingsleyae]|uniref:uncharacterized protein zbtb48 isoform X3 n=1 Tax=Paramormyrops kingsleyae TaxID=1676925 RepID=UPI000CD64C31|nr:telomere zinc finger-associated protein isoform X3 [Paramormyrops kingsleyae]
MAPLENTHAERLLSSLNQQRALGRFCDAILSTGSGKCYKVHRNVLACFSEIFQSACPTSTSHMEYCLPDDCSTEGLELLLDFVYTGKLELDSANLEKVQCAAVGLSIQDALRICQEFASNMTCLKGPQGPKDGKGGGDEEHSHGASPKDTSKPDVPIRGNPRPRLKSKSRPKVCNSVPKQLTVTTTTRSGRRVKGPIRLLRESPTPPDTRMREPMSVERGPDGAEASDQNFEQPVNESEVYQKEQPSNDMEDEDCGEVDGQEDTDDEYMPHSLAGMGPAPQQVKRRRRRKAISKENGEQAGGDPKRGSVQCPTCQKTFFSKYYLKVHNRRHTGEKPFECSKCGKCYYRKENLLEHEARNCLRRTEVVFSCSMCPMTFQRRLELRLHTVTHTGEMPNKCSSCPEQFMQKKDLKIHLIKVHGAPKPHACSLCPKCFLSRTELRLHEASKHRGEKLFVCEECGHRASSRNGLQMHIKAIHRNERPFVCEFCNHAFTQKANLNMHLRTHTGEKPFQCHLCGKTFRTQAWTSTTAPTRARGPSTVSSVSSASRRRARCSVTWRASTRRAGRTTVTSAPRPSRPSSSYGSTCDATKACGSLSARSAATSSPDRPTCDGTPRSTTAWRTTTHGRGDCATLWWTTRRRPWPCCRPTGTARRRATSSAS